MRYLYTLHILFSLLLLCSCNNGDEPQVDIPITMSAHEPSAFARAALPAGMCDNFKVYAALEMGGVQQPVMSGYEVRFTDDTWDYVTASQPIVFWNGSADRYLFAAGAPIDSVTAISATTMTLYMENNIRGSVLAATPLTVAKVSAEFGKPLTVNFNYVHSRIAVAFVKNAPTESVIADITLTPDAPIASKANANFTFDWDAATYSQAIDITATSAAALAFADVAIPADTGDAVVSATRFYCIPTDANPTGWTVSLTVNGESKSAHFANDKIWQSGRSYLYIFTLDDIAPKLVKVISQDMTFDCLDIVPGGEFSDADMTE